MLSLQDKIGDSHAGQPGRSPLPPEKRRARIELRAMLTQLTEQRLASCKGLAELRDVDPDWPCGIATLSDLKRANFEALRRGFFDFVLPTLPAGGGEDGAAPDQTQWSVFSRSGAYGLDLCHRALHEMGMAERRRKPRGHRGRSLRLGPKGYNVSCQGLHERMRQPLSRLSRAWARFDLPRGDA